MMATNNLFLTMLAQQLEEARRFWKNKQIRTALIVPWAEAFTAAFLVPVLPYFMQGLGLRATEMGQLRTVQQLLNAASAPVAGMLLDSRGPFVGIALPSSLCAIGCLLRSLATSFDSLLVAAIFSGLSGAKFDMSIAHLSRHTPPSSRTLAVSAASVQIRLLTFVGTACFTPLNWFLQQWLPAARFGMLRLRLLISLCMWGCGFGVLVLLFASRTLTFNAHTISGADAAAKGATSSEEGEPAERGPICEGASDKEEPPSDVAARHATPHTAPSTSPAAASALDWPSSPHLSPVLGLTLTGLLFTRFFTETTGLTWPLFIKHHFGWDESEYALLLPLQQALAITLIATPHIHQRLGSSRAIALLGGLSVVCLGGAYSLQAHHQPSLALHILLILTGGVANAALELVLTAIASTYVPPTYQGRLFAAIAVARYAGSAAANLGGAALFQSSLTLVPSDAPFFARGGALPLTLAAIPAGANVIALAWCARATGHGSDDRLGGSHKASESDDDSLM